MRIAKCPHDSAPMGLVPESGEFTGRCDECGQQFKLLFGTVRKSNSRQEKIPNTSNWTRLYEFWVTREDGGEEIVRFKLRGRQVRVEVKSGSPVTYCVRLPNWDPIYLHNRATNDTSWLGSARPHKKTNNGTAMQVIGACGVALMALTALTEAIAGRYDVIPGALLFGAIAAAFIVGGTLMKKDSAPASTDPMKPILVELVGIDSRLDQLRRDEDQLKKARAKLTDLIAEMTDVGGDLYSARIDKLKRAIALIDDQLQSDRELQREYKRTRKMVAIEIKSMQTHAAVQPSLDLLRKRRGEMEQIEAENEERRLQLEAIDEVERIVS